MFIYNIKLKILYINILLSFLVFFNATTLISQIYNLGTPSITNHGNDKMGSGVEIWDIEKVYGQLIFGSNAGLMIYNGEEWLSFSTPKNTIIRSLAVKDHKSIYIGAQSEIGYFSLNNHDQLSYTSIKEMIDPQYQNLSEIWDIEYLENEVYFSSDNNVLCYSNGITKRFGQNSWIDIVKKVGNQIWYHALDEGIYIINNGEEQLIPGSEKFNGVQIVDILKATEEKTFIITERKGIFQLTKDGIQAFKSNYTPYLIEKEIISVDYDSNWGFLIGTKLGGFININNSGQANFHLSKNTGLLNNRINCIKILENGTLWLGSNSGVDEVDLSNNLFNIFPDNELEGAVYDVDEWNGAYFFSTSNGLYTIPKAQEYTVYNKQVFQQIPNTNGQTWGTQIINGHLYCAHHQGPLRITRQLNAEKISGAESAWKFIPLKDDYIALGYFTGINVYKQMPDGSLIERHKVTGLNESSRIIIFDKNENLWMSHPYKSVYKITFDKDYTASNVTTYTAENGFRENDKNYIFDINGVCYLTNPSGIYRYNNTLDSFELCPFLNKYYSNEDHVKRLIQDGENLYAISNNSTTHFIINQSGLETELHHNKKLNIPNEGFIGGFEELIPTEEALFISRTEGIQFYQEENVDFLNEPMIKKIKILSQRDSVIYSGIESIDKLNLNYDQNALKFYLGNKWPKSNNRTEYAYRIKGSQKSWSPWQSKSQVEIYNLNSGAYTFEFKSKDYQGRESIIQSLDIQITPPFYLDKWALSLYIIFGTALIFAGILIPKKRYEKNTAKLEDENKKASEELKVIKKEKIDNEVEYKNRELASTTLHLVKKNQTLNKLSDMIMSLKKESDNKKTKQQLNKMLSTIKYDINEDEEWDKFNFYFDQVHQQFVDNLKTRFPNLSKNDFKLCAFLRMNLSTKEIAPLLNISVRGVEISRYRLRKKLGLERQTNLNDFLNSEALNS